MTQLVYDNTFEGFLTAVFEVYEYKYSHPQIIKKSQHVLSLLDDTVEVITDTFKAHRVLSKIEKSIHKEGVRVLLFSFLSENSTVEKYMFEVIRYILKHPEKNVLQDFSNSNVNQLHKFTKSVGREKHRMEAFVRFEELKDGTYFAKIAPDFDVLMLLLKHFKNRYQDQKWIIYDISRNYGLYYDLDKVEVITLDIDLSDLKNESSILSEQELKYQDLWIEYFDHTNIIERKNMKLHYQHVPKRYWKYLTERRN